MRRKQGSIFVVRKNSSDQNLFKFEKLTTALIHVENTYLHFKFNTQTNSTDHKLSPYKFRFGSESIYLNEISDPKFTLLKILPRIFMQ